MEHNIEVTPELLMKAFEDTKEGMFENGQACASQIGMGFITLKNGKRALVTIRIENEEEL